MNSNINNKENETEKPKKPDLTKIKRPVLGEIGNQAVPKAILNENPTVKSADYKHVSPRVDCRRQNNNEKEKNLHLLLKQREKELKGQTLPSDKPKEVKIYNGPPKILITRPSDENVNFSQPQNKSDSQKLQGQIEDIDQGNENLFLVNDYANDIYNYLFELENCNIIQEEYLKNHIDITPSMRTILIDWLSETHTQLKLALETYFLTVTLIDKYLQNHPETIRNDLQLVGCTAFFVAAKYEEVCELDIKECVYMMDEKYTAKQICKMEKVLLQTVNYQLGQPLSILFLRRFSKAANAEAVIHLMGKYFIELVSIEYSMAHLKKSLIAAASLYLAIHIYRKATSFISSLWTLTLEYYSNYFATDLQPVSVQIIKLIINAPKGHKNKYHAIYIKYSMPKNDEISKKLAEPKAKEMLRILLNN